MFFPNLGAIATTNVITVDIHETVQDALEKMHRYDHRSVVVVNGPLYYIVTTKDLIRCRIEGTYFDTPLSKIPLRPLPRMRKESNIVDVLGVADESDEYICVCNEDDTLYGLVTNSDIVSSVDPQLILDTLQIATIFDNKFGFCSFSPDAPMASVMLYLKDSPSDCVIVEREGTPAGILTSKDLLRFIGEGKSEAITVEEEMSSPIRTLDSRASISEGLEFIKRHHYKRIVVTDDEGKIMGVVTQQDLISRTYLRWSQLMRDHYSQFEELNQILQQKNRQLEVLATHDSLTGVYNRHMFCELFAKEHALLKRHGGKISLLILDLDHFKTINDTHGHNIGDYVLKTFAHRVSSLIREADVFARWGGEEFVLMLRGTSCEEGYAVAEKIRRRIEEEPFKEVGVVTCSIGMAEVESGDSIQSAIERADNALYAAKEKGRNQTVACRRDGV